MLLRDLCHKQSRIDSRALSLRVNPANGSRSDSSKQKNRFEIQRKSNSSPF